MRDNHEYRIPYKQLGMEYLNICDYDSIGEDLILGAKCKFNNAIKISREWCKGSDIDSITHMLGISKTVVTGIYYKASDVAENFIRSNINEWQVGGPGAVVITFPQKYWLETLDVFDSDNREQIKFIKSHILQTVRTIVAPGSILVTPYNSILCSRKDFECLKSLYPTIVSIKDLTRHNNEKQNVFTNLASIWKTVLDVCEEAQFHNSFYIRQFVVGHMWRRRYGERAFEYFCIS
ncbi:hypothetical protein NQ317_011556 [Molorchus minor]|uniref:Uncharacterized protein n=1 Tax=Molorchus minor TaxID=1323400 RepID=A0ABQ9JUF3_9CUCU|nr:hypothetical protein NQ317_011556 [Molorchus minor]